MAGRDRDFARDERNEREEDQEAPPTFRRGARLEREEDVEVDEEPARRGRRSKRWEDEEDVGEDSVEEQPPRKPLLARLILPVGGGILAGGALLAGLTMFLGGGSDSPVVVAGGERGGVGAPAPVGSSLAPGFGNAVSLPPPGGSGTPSSPLLAPSVAALPDMSRPREPGSAAAGGASAPTGLFPGGGTPSPGAAAPEVAEQAQPVATLRDIQAIWDRLSFYDGRMQAADNQLQAMQAVATRYQRSLEAVLAGLGDMRAELDAREAEVAALRAMVERREPAPGASAASSAPATPSTPAAASSPPRQPPPQIPVRVSTFANHTRLVLAFPAEPVYDVDQRDDIVRVRFLGNELPNLLGLPSSIRNVESLASTSGMLEIRVSEGVNVRHAMMGTQVALSFFNRGVEPPATAGQAPRERRPEPVASERNEATPASVVTPATVPASVPVPGPVSGSAPVSASVPASVPASAAAAGSAETGMAALEGWRLRSVSRRAVLVENAQGEIHRVELGQALPGSRVIAQEVRRDGDVWVLVTSVGILRP